MAQKAQILTMKFAPVGYHSINMTITAKKKFQMVGTGINQEKLIMFPHRKDKQTRICTGCLRQFDFFFLKG